MMSYKIIWFLGSISTRVGTTVEGRRPVNRGLVGWMVVAGTPRVSTSVVHRRAIDYLFNSP